MRIRCRYCDAISLQRVTTEGQYCHAEFVERVAGKKPYKVRCKKCGRTWTTGAEYARALSGDAWRADKKCVTIASAGEVVINLPAAPPGMVFNVKQRKPKP